MTGLSLHRHDKQITAANLETTYAELIPARPYLRDSTHLALEKSALAILVLATVALANPALANLALADSVSADLALAI